MWGLGKHICGVIAEMILLYLYFYHITLEKGKSTDGRYLSDLFVLM